MPHSEKHWTSPHRPAPDTNALIRGIASGDRMMLSRAITMVESTRADHQEIAQNVIKASLPGSGKSIRIGVTGAPGVGKSTFIEALGSQLVARGHKVAVLAIDPSSQVSKGSILGDKTRMEKLGNHPNAFIRPSPAGGSLGGVARKTRETIILCEAAGFDVIFVETVGVGQSETSVHSMVDIFLLLLLPGAGDELQGIKRGIVEMADILAVNKAEGERKKLAKKSKQAYRNALQLLPPKESGWKPKIHICSAVSGEGMQVIWQNILEFVEQVKANGYFQKNREQQAGYWFRESVRRGLEAMFFENAAMQDKTEALQQEVLRGLRSPFQAAEELIRLFAETR